MCLTADWRCTCTPTAQRSLHDQTITADSQPITTGSRLANHRWRRKMRIAYSIYLYVYIYTHRSTPFTENENENIK